MKDNYKTICLTCIELSNPFIKLYLSKQGRASCRWKTILFSAQDPSSRSPKKHLAKTDHVTS